MFAVSLELLPLQLLSGGEIMLISFVIMNFGACCLDPVSIHANPSSCFKHVMSLCCFLEGLTCLDLAD